MHIISKDGMGYLHKEWSVIFDGIDDISRAGFKLLYAVTSYELLENIKIKLQKISKADSMEGFSKDRLIEMGKWTISELYTPTNWIVFGILNGMKISLSFNSYGKVIVGVPITEMTEEKELAIHNMLASIELELNKKKGN